MSLAWGGTTLSVHHLRTSRSFRIGSDDDCNLYVPQEYTRTQNLPVLLEGPGPALRVVIPAGASARLQLPGKPAFELEQALSRGIAQACPDFDGAHQVYLTPGMRVSICFARCGDGPETPYRRKPAIDDSLVLTIAWVDELRWKNVWSFAALMMAAVAILCSAGVHAGALATIAYTKPDLYDDELASLDHQVIHHSYIVGTTVAEYLDPEPPPLSEDDAVLPGSVVIDADPGASGEMGDRRGIDALLRWGNQGPEDNPDQHLGLPGMKEWQDEWGTCCFMSFASPTPWPESGGPSSPAGLDSSLGVDAASARGKNTGKLIGNAHGARGLGRAGQDSGANARGNGAGALETGSCADSKPVLLAGVPAISGPAQVQSIRPVVRQHLSRFQSCYETALIERPSLRGRIVINAVIGDDGQVESVSDGGSNLPAPAVVECVVQTFGTLTFPDVKQGPVRLSWPFVVADG